MFAKYWRKYTKDFLVGTFSQVLISYGHWSVKPLLVLATDG